MAVSNVATMLCWPLLHSPDAVNYCSGQEREGTSGNVRLAKVGKISIIPQPNLIYNNLVMIYDICDKSSSLQDFFLR